MEKLQLENGLKNRKRLIEIERVERMSQLALAEWLPGSQRAKVTKQSGQKWDSFGFVEKSQLYLLPEEAMILLEMVMMHDKYKPESCSLFTYILNYINLNCYICF